MSDLEDYMPWIVGAGAVIGILTVEYIYFTDAEEVRLLFVLLLVPFGAVVGGIVAGLLVLILGISVWALGVGLVLAVIGGIIYLLYSIVIWTN